MVVAANCVPSGPAMAQVTVGVPTTLLISATNGGSQTVTWGTGLQFEVTYPNLFL